MYFFGLFLMAVGLTAIKADVDCKEHKPHIEINSCCAVLEFVSTDVREKCEAKIGNENFEMPHERPKHHRGPPRGFKHGPRHACLYSCVVNETGILIDNEYREDNVESYLTEVFHDSEKVEFLINKFNYCNDKRNNMESKFPEFKKHGPPNCPNMHDGMLLGCVHIEAFKECPDTFWSNTDECNAARDHFNQCFPFKGMKEENIPEEEDEVEEI